MRESQKLKEALIEEQSQLALQGLRHSERFKLVTSLLQLEIVEASETGESEVRPQDRLSLGQLIAHEC